MFIKFYKHLTSFIILLFLSTFSLSGQEQKFVLAEHPVLNHSVDWAIALGEISYTNLTVSIPYYMYLSGSFGPDFDFKSNIKKSFTMPFKWDRSNYLKNQLAHPYFGVTYFVEGRANNLNFFESSLLTLTGSLMWETLFESAPGSLNDVITTTTTGIMLGEALHRLYFPVNDFFAPLSFFVSPVDTFTKLLRGKTSAPPAGSVNVAEVYTGAGLSFTPGFVGNAGFFIEYNDLYGHKTKEPFDQFILSLDGNPSTDCSSFELKETGLMFSIPIFKEDSKSNFGFTLGYDLYYSTKTHYALETAGLLLAQKISTSISDDFNSFFMWKLLLNGVYLGVTDNYNYGGQLDFCLNYENPLAGTFGLETSGSCITLYPQNYNKKDNTMDIIVRANAYYEHFIKVPFYIGIKYDFLLKYDIFLNQNNSIYINNNLILYCKIRYKS